MKRQMKRQMKTALTIAGSDSSGGAGIQADLKTFTCCKVYGMSAITSLTAQNTTGVFSIMDVSPEFLEEQIKAVALDIFPDAVKIGMVSSSKLIEVIEKSIKKYGFKNIVVDPVMVSTSGFNLIQNDALSALKKLFPLASLITPNISEAEIISNTKIKSKSDMENAAKIIFNNFKTPVLVKGGHSLCDADDFLYSKNGGKWFYGKRIKTENTHGTGCTLSSAIAANLSKGFTLEKSIKNAKKYLTGALKKGLNLGKGSGPLMHNWNF